RREAPRGRGGETTQRVEFAPARSAVVAPEDHAGLRAGVDRAVGRAHGEGEDVAGGEVRAGPRGPAVVAPPHAAAARAGEDPAGLARVDGDALEPRVLEDDAGLERAVAFREAGEAAVGDGKEGHGVNEVAAAAINASTNGPNRGCTRSPNTFQLLTTPTMRCCGSTTRNWPPKPSPPQTSVPCRSMRHHW